MAGDRHKIKHVYHLVIGLTLILKGWEKIEHHYAVLGAILVLFGLITLFYCVLLLRGAHWVGRRLHLGAHLFEALAMLFTSYVFFRDGKHYIQYVTLLAALGFFGSFLIMLRHPEPTRPEPTRES